MTDRSGSAVPSPPLTRERADTLLAALGERYERLATAMYALDTHPGHEFLRTTQVTGATLALRETVQHHAAILWAQFAALGDLKERATTTRSRRNRPSDAELSELTLLLCDPVVGLDGDGVPVAGTGATPTIRVRLSELAETIESGCADLTDKLDQLAAEVTAAVDRITPMTEALTAADTLADGLGLGPERGLAPLADELVDLRERILDDPLTGAADAALNARLRRLATDIDTARNHLMRLDQLRRSAPQRLAAADTLVQALASAEADAAEAYRAAREKIADHGLPALPDATTKLRADLAAIGELADGGKWATFGERLLAWEKEAERATARARDFKEAADGLLARRTELRGRLQAYQAKATRLGVAEEPTVASRYREARDLLWTSPCQLRAATRALLSYQQAITAAGERS